MTARDLLAAYGERINEHDFDQLVPLLSSDCLFWFSSGSHAGIPAARAAFEHTWSVIQDEVYRIEDVRWLGETDDVAVCVYTFHWVGVIEGETRQGRGRGTSCFRTEEGVWKLVHEHLSSFPA